VTCPYVTSLGRPCGRPSTNGEHCDFHGVLHEFETNCTKSLNDTISDLYDAIGGLAR
jgi:hypothetical protein